MFPHLKMEVPELLDQTTSPCVAVTVVVVLCQVFGLELADGFRDSAEYEVPPAQVVLLVTSSP